MKGEATKAEAKDKFQETVNITTEGQRHLGVVIGSSEFKGQYCAEKINKWKDELLTLSEIAETHPQMAYAVYIKGYISKVYILHVNN